MFHIEPHVVFSLICYVAMSEKGQRSLESFWKNGTSSAENRPTPTEEPSISDFEDKDRIISSDEFDEEENDHYLAISGTSAASGDSQDSNEDVQSESDDDGDVLMSGNSSDNEQPPRKKPRSAKTSKHRKTGFDERWKKSFKWLDTLVEQGKVGMICKVCQKQSSVPRSKKKVWISEPCFQLRVDKIKQHEKSSLHRQSLLAEANRSVYLRVLSVKALAGKQRVQLVVVNAYIGCVSRRFYIQLHILVLLPLQKTWVVSISKH